jgi:hypothetical protein
MMRPALHRESTMKIKVVKKKLSKKPLLGCPYLVED